MKSLYNELDFWSHWIHIWKFPQDFQMGIPIDFPQVSHSEYSFPIPTATLSIGDAVHNYKIVSLSRVVAS